MCGAIDPKHFSDQHNACFKAEFRINEPSIFFSLYRNETIIFCRYDCWFSRGTESKNNNLPDLVIETPSLYRIHVKHLPLAKQSGIQQNALEFTARLRSNDYQQRGRVPRNESTRVKPNNCRSFRNLKRTFRKWIVEFQLFCDALLASSCRHLFRKRETCRELGLGRVIVVKITPKNKLDWTAGKRTLDYDKREPLKYLTSFDLSRLKRGGKTGRSTFRFNLRCKTSQNRAENGNFGDFKRFTQSEFSFFFPET